MRKFKHTKDGHNKWWQIEVRGSSYVVSYGRIGSKGEELVKNFGSATKAQEEADKIIASKLKKGYEEEVVPAKAYAKDPSTLEGRINTVLMNFSMKHNTDLTYIEDCDFRGEPRAMEYERKYADDVEMKPLCDLALQIDTFILESPRHVALSSTSPYVRDCAQWYAERWDPMFTHDEEAARALIRAAETAGPESLRTLGLEPKYSTPMGKAVVLKDRVITDSNEMQRLGEDASEGTIWIVTSDSRGAERYIKVSSSPEVWCPLM